jgi:hypothetical protein
MHEPSMNHARGMHEPSKAVLAPLIPDSLNLIPDSLNPSMNYEKKGNGYAKNKPSSGVEEARRIKEKIMRGEALGS